MYICTLVNSTTGMETYVFFGVSYLAELYFVPVNRKTAFKAIAEYLLARDRLSSMFGQPSLYPTGGQLVQYYIGYWTKICPQMSNEGSCQMSFLLYRKLAWRGFWPNNFSVVLTMTQWIVVKFQVKSLPMSVLFTQKIPSRQLCWFNSFARCSLVR
jgi:hypothetical protein